MYFVQGVRANRTRDTVRERAQPVDSCGHGIDHQDLVRTLLYSSQEQQR